MLLIAEIILTIVAWNKGWKWLALLPLGIGAGISFLIGLMVGASGGSADDIMWVVVFDIIVIIVLIWMIVRPKIDLDEEVKKIEEKKEEKK